MCPVIAVTAYRDEDTHKQAIKVGMKQVLGKPVLLNDLHDILGKFYYVDIKPTSEE